MLLVYVHIYDYIHWKPSISFYHRFDCAQEIGFFGMRGKKIPVNFRGKFVGVRGKKVPGGVALRGFHAGELAMPELQSAHLVDASAAAASEFSNKRAPSGFHGMRGKKWQLTGTLHLRVGGLEFI